MSKKDKKQLDDVDFLTVYLYVDSLRREDIKLLKKEVKRLSELTKWQPIETAPKNGTWILLYEYQEPTGVDYFDNWCPSIQQGRYDEYDGWKKCSEYSIGFKPTHWMPLPKLPAK
jgi:hypothetical protein